MISALLFLWFFLAFLWTVNALRRPVPPHRRFPPLWLPGMVVSELGPIFFVFRALVLWLLVLFGGADRLIGQVGIGLFALSEFGLLVVIWRSFSGARSTGSPPSYWSLFKVRERRPSGVKLIEEVPYWNDLTLDVMARPGLSSAPTLIYIHPGSWMRGRPGRQARALFHRLANLGWVILDIRYPLSPQATFPDHLIGVKKAIAWAKSEGNGYGVDPNRVAISGGSSGAHLAALSGLTWDHPDLQPGFEQDDTRPIACLPFYGIYDLLVRNPTRYDWPFIARYVMKAHPTDAPALYQLGSPVDQVRADPPPFFVVHGEFDSVVLPSESRHFVEALRTAGARVAYHEVGGAQHGFDAFASLRSRAVAEMCAKWLVEQAALGS